MRAMLRHWKNGSVPFAHRLWPLIRKGVVSPWSSVTLWSRNDNIAQTPKPISARKVGQTIAAIGQFLRLELPFQAAWSTGATHMQPAPL